VLLFELTLVLLLAAVLLAALARRLEVPYPSLLALDGSACSGTGARKVCAVICLWAGAECAAW
jgi:hypothetical protein